MLIIPAIDLIKGKCVRLTQGDYSRQKVYGGNPVKIAQQFEKDGANILHVIDLEGAKAKRPMNMDKIFAIRKATCIPIQIGGGIRNLKTAKTYLGTGIDRIIIGTKAIGSPGFLKKLISEFGSSRIVVSIDIRDGRVAAEGWQKMSKIPYLRFAKKLKKIGVTEIICTDIKQDGTLGKTNMAPLEKLKKLGFNVVAAGGVADVKTLGALKRAGLYGAIIGKAIYEKKITVREALNAIKPKSNLIKRIIPCMDIKNGRVVKGTHFKKLRDAGDPVELGKYYSEQGADELIFLDITATVEKRKTLVDLVKRVAKQINIPFCVGGGIRNIADIKALLKVGADKVSIGSAAVTNPGLINRAAKCFGSQCIVISVDPKRVGNKWLVYIRGGRDKKPIDAIEFSKEMERRGAGELLVNSLDRDGTKKGYDLKLLRAITSRVNIPVIASSGAGCQKDFLDAFDLGECDAALAASLFHYGKIKIPKLKKYLSSKNVNTRL